MVIKIGNQQRCLPLGWLPERSSHAAVLRTAGELAFSFLHWIVLGLSRTRRDFWNKKCRRVLFAAYRQLSYTLKSGSYRPTSNSMRMPSARCNPPRTFPGAPASLAGPRPRPAGGGPVGVYSRTAFGNDDADEDESLPAPSGLRTA